VVDLIHICLRGGGSTAAIDRIFEGLIPRDLMEAPETISHHSSVQSKTIMTFLRRKDAPKLPGSKRPALLVGAFAAIGGIVSFQISRSVCMSD
jgi:hypothetical protein